MNIMALTLKNGKPGTGMQYELPLMQPENRTKLVASLTACYAGVLCVRGPARYVRLCKTGRQRFAFRILTGASKAAQA